MGKKSKNEWIYVYIYAQQKLTQHYKATNPLKLFFFKDQDDKIKVLEGLAHSEDREERTVPGLSPWLVDGHLLSVSPHLPPCGISLP